jgi:hypothetical protein
VLKIRDYDGETTTTNIHLTPLLSDGSNYAAIETAANNIKAAVENMILGTVEQAQLVHVFDENITPTVADPNAQREVKWLVTMQDTTQYLDAANTVVNPGYGKVWQFEIGTAELAELAPNSDEADPAGDVSTLKLQLEANARSPWNYAAASPTQSLISVRHVGRAT